MHKSRRVKDPSVIPTVARAERKTAVRLDPHSHQLLEAQRNGAPKGEFWKAVIKQQLAKKSFDAEQLAYFGRKRGENQPDPDGLWQTDDAEVYRAVIALEDTLDLSRSTILRAFVAMHLAERQESQVAS